MIIIIFDKKYTTFAKKKEIINKKQRIKNELQT